MKNYIHNRLFYSILLLPVLLLTGCGSSAQPVSKTGFYFDTVITVTLYDASKEPLLEECFSMAESYENMFSRTKEGSDIWQLNHAKGAPVQVSAQTVTLLKTALSYADLTDGLVDPTIGAVSSLWDFKSESSPSLPDKDLLTEALSHVDYHNVTILEDNTVLLQDPDAILDLGFIAKGYIADRFRDYLLSQGVENAIINLGGNVLTIGHKPDGSPFLVGIQKPFADTGVIAYTLEAPDLSVVSSGVYERCFTLDGVLYHHMLDAKTGYPVRNNLSEVTILSTSSTDGDALSTACFLLGLEEGMELIESLPDTEAVFITDDGRLHSTSGARPL